MPPCIRNCHSGLVKLQQRIHKEIRCFINVRRKKMWHIKNAVVFYYEAKIIIEMRKKLLTRGGVYFLRDFQKGHKWTKKLPPTIFFLEIIHQWTSFYHFRKKRLLINPRFYFTDTRKQLWNCCNIFESAVSITSPLKTITDPLKEIKMVKTDPKKVPSQIFFLLVPLGTFAQLFMKKNFQLHNPLKHLFCVYKYCLYKVQF